LSGSSPGTGSETGLSCNAGSGIPQKALTTFTPPLRADPGPKRENPEINNLDEAHRLANAEELPARQSHDACPDSVL
jgi:hypothetical protein